LEALGPAAGNGRFIALLRKLQLQPLGDVRVILDNQDAPFLSLLLFFPFP